MGDYGFGQDPIISACDSWSPNGADGGIFGDRDDAEDQTKAGALRDATGKGVNVIIVDRGLDRNWINDTKVRMAARRNLRSSDPASTVLGWTRYRWTGRYSNARFLPGASGSPHGHMIARNVLAIAPEANIWDAPLLPSAD